MGRGAREMVLDVNKFRCRNSGRGIYKLTSFTLAHYTRESNHKVTTIPGAGCYGLGFLGYFCFGLLEKVEDVKILPNDITDFEIERMKSQTPFKLHRLWRSSLNCHEPSPPHHALLSCTFLPKFTSLTTQVDLSCLPAVAPLNSFPAFLITLWHPW